MPWSRQGDATFGTMAEGPGPAHDPEFRAAFGLREGEQFATREEEVAEWRRIAGAYEDRTDPAGESLRQRALQLLSDADEPTGGAGPAPPIPVAAPRAVLAAGATPERDPVYRAAFGAREDEVAGSRELWLAELRRIARDYASRQDRIGQDLYRQAVARLKEAEEEPSEELSVRVAG